MAPDYSLLIAILAGLLALDAVAALAVFEAKRRSRAAHAARSARMRRFNRAIIGLDGATIEAEFRKDPWACLFQIRRTLERAKPGPEQLAALAALRDSVDLEGLAERKLRSPFLHERIDAYCCLGLASSEGSAGLLVEALGRERRALGRMTILSRLAIHPAGADVGAMLAALRSARQPAREREIAALLPCAARIKAYFDLAGPPRDEVGLRLYLLAVRSFPSRPDFEPLSTIALEDPFGLGEEAIKTMSERFPSDVFLSAFASRTEPRFRLHILRLLGLTLPPESLTMLEPWFADPAMREEAIAAASSVLRLHPGSELAFLAGIEGAGRERGSALSRAIEHRLPSLLYHAPVPLDPGLRRMIGYLIEEERTGILVEALLSPLPAETRAAFVSCVREGIAERPSAASGLARALGPEDRAALGLGDPLPEPNRPRIPVSGRDKLFLAGLVALGVATLPAIFLIWRGPELAALSFPEVAYRFLFDFQYLFAFYTIAINGVYLILLGLSVFKLRSESLLWERDLSLMLSTPGVLPSISIIAPAFNEEATIVESLQSLCALAYPSYELIVVNDGSKDDTLGAISRAFDLELVGTGESGALPTMPIRALYRSASQPNLTVIDKANGGKADALNAGLNRASGDFVCTIDADSILDSQALMKMMFQLVACDGDVIAIGGNVFPVNGCSVEHGHLQEISLSEEPLVRFQVIEYLRSFVAGRLGWTVLDSLLIIAGAFGVFKRSSLLELGGYMAGSGRFRHETVGEDMEIVVRLKRREREAGRRGRVEYAYNANCWTEVPEDWTPFAKQRDRWHRGLLEVLCFHRGMALRPRYGGAGMISMPYFFVFELIGPWVESFGYLVLAAVLLLNLIDPLVPLTVFGISVFFGALISIASFLLAEQQILYFRSREFFKLLGMSLLESLGFRQLVSMLRVKANIEFFFVKKGWGTQDRKGFSRRAEA